MKKALLHLRKVLMNRVCKCNTKNQFHVNDIDELMNNYFGNLPDGNGMTGARILYDYYFNHQYLVNRKEGGKGWKI